MCENENKYESKYENNNNKKAISVCSQKKRLLKRSVVLRNSIVRLRIFKFVSNVKFSEPNSKRFTS